MRVVIFLCLITLLAAAVGCGLFQSRPENVLFIVIDALRTDHLGCYGYFRNTSPHLDRLAEKSTVFDQAYTLSPWTMASVASMFTSLHPKDHGIANWLNPLQESLLTVAEVFREKGYHTVGQASHVIFRPKYGFDQGFDEFSIDATRHGDVKYVSTSEQVTDLALKALDRPIQKPFFMWLHYFDPHNNYLHHKQFDFGKSRADRYDSEIAFTDFHIGRLLDRMAQKGLMKNTVIVVTADHGEEFRDHGGILHTRTLYEEVLRIPLIVYVPGFTPGRIGHTVPSLDLAPTMLQLVGLPIPEPFQGKPVLFAKKRFLPGEDRPVFAETREQADKRAIRKGRWKLIQDRREDRFYLFDIQADPREETDLAGQRPDLVEQLRNHLTDYHSHAAPPAPTTEMSGELKEKLQSLGYMQ